MPQGCQNAHGGIHACEQIGHSHAHFLRSTPQVIALTCDAHQAADTLNGIVITCPIAVGASLTKARDTAINKFWIEGLEAVVVEPISGHVPDFEVFNEDMAMHDQFANQCLALGLRDVASQ